MSDAERTGAPPRWLLITLAIIAAAAVAFAIGRFTAFGTGSAPSTPTTDSADAGFARDMQVHHAQAVEMALITYRLTEDPALRTLAYDIATTQAVQSGEMAGWLVQWGLPSAGSPLMTWMADADGGHSGHDAGADGEPATDAELREAMGMATTEQIAELGSLTGGAGDCLFYELMIRHHEGAIDMVDAVLERGDDARVLDVAASMASVQLNEIELMRTMQASAGCAA